MKKRLSGIAALVAALVGAAVAVGIILLKKTFTLAGAPLFAALSDAFFVAGVLVCALGALSLLYTAGIFDGVFYNGGMVLTSLLPFMYNYQYKSVSYTDYKAAKHKKDKKKWEWLIVGGGYIAVGIVMYILYSARL